jgi:hypothetical protein
MSDEKPPIIFVNTLAVNGFLNGVLNLAFSTAHWFPVTAEGQQATVGIAEHITVDLRMDLACAQATRDALDRIIQQQTKPSKSEVN